MAYNPYMINYTQPPASDALNQLKYPYTQPQYIQPQNTPVPYNDMIWVLGEEAMSFPVAPNSTVTLWDKNQPTIYVKSVNMQGVPSMRVLDFTERTAQTNTQTKHECTCGKDLEALNGRISALEEQIKNLKKTQEE